MPDTSTPLDLDALVAAEAEAKHYRAQRDEWFLMESGAREAAEAEVILLRTRIRKARHQRDEARAEVARLTARHDPTWDEEAVLVALVDAHLASVRQVMEDGYPSIFVRSNEDVADAALAVVRDHLPVKPHRDALAAAIRLRHREMGSGVETVTVDDYESADAALSLLPGRSEAKVKAEALREWIAEWPTTPDDGTFLADVARDGLARADRLAAEGGVNRE